MYSDTTAWWLQAFFSWRIGPGAAVFCMAASELSLKGGWRVDT